MAAMTAVFRLSSLYLANDIASAILVFLRFAVQVSIAALSVLIRLSSLYLANAITSNIFLLSLITIGKRVCMRIGDPVEGVVPSDRRIQEDVERIVTVL